MGAHGRARARTGTRGHAGAEGDQLGVHEGAPPNANDEAADAGAGLRERRVSRNGARFTASPRTTAGSKHLQTLLNAVTPHQAAVRAPLVAAMSRLLTEWPGVYAQSASSGGSATSSQEAKKLRANTCN